ncbi:ShET2/EspL2 family type III secretion system effector toxin [Undibacterium sp. SXout7W]|uniref:ShET2/EspL2 family type III secretion system effector toxin n=1 Tax=Undibacterium sp. SXout7W TaxID=3413049 RepID=UPI003BEFB320
MMPTSAITRTPGRNSHSSISSPKFQKDAQWKRLVNEYHNNKFGHYDEELIATIEDTLFGENHSFLNMSGCHENDVRGLEEKSPGIIARLQTSGVTEIHLPENLKAIPSWLEKMPHLTSLKMPDVDVPKALDLSGAELLDIDLPDIGALDISDIDISDITEHLDHPSHSDYTLDFRDLKQKCPNLNLIHISTKQSANIIVYENIQVLPSGHAPSPKDIVIKIDIYGKDDKPLRQQTLAGRSYYAQYRGAKLSSTAIAMRVDDWNRKANLNGEAKFPYNSLEGMEQSIKCCHLATYWLWQPKNIGERLLTNIVTKMGAQNDIAQNIPASIDARFHEIAWQGKENYLVGHDAWGGFMHDQFTQMKSNQTQRIIVQSGSHAMALLLKVKNQKGFTEYVAEFFDPNLTLTHVRLVETNLQNVSAWTRDNFMEEDTQATYYKEYGAADVGGDVDDDDDMESEEQVAYEDCSLFIKAPENLDAHSMDEPLWANDSRERTTKFFPTSLRQKKSSAVMWHAGMSNLSGVLREQLVEMQGIDMEEKKQILKENDSEGNSKFIRLFTRSNPEVLKTFLVGIKEMRLDQSDLVELLSRDHCGSALLCSIMLTEGKAEHVAAILEGIKELGLSKENLHTLLLAKSGDGTTGLRYAITLDYQDTVAAFLTGFKNLGLDSEDFVKFASEKDENQSCLMKDVITDVTSDAREHFLSCIQELGLGSAELDELRNSVLSE